MTLVDRATRCILSWRVVTERSTGEAQAMVDESPSAALYFSDGFEMWASLSYLTGQHWVVWGKSQTYSVEGDNAELRHYLARLARKSRCFSRSLDALRRSVI